VHSINTFLILDNSDIFPLNKTVVNIGRRPENDLQIFDPRISRNHAQLRSAHGHYQIFDLNSTGGTYVNGQRVTQHALKPVT
jgi:pSer/pThr/pTyr-binding forkhead associated (FHA) protein